MKNLVDYLREQMEEETPAPHSNVSENGEEGKQEDVKEFDESVFENEEIQVLEGKVDSEESFREYAETLFKKAFGDKFDEEKMKKVVDGILKDHADDDWGAKVGILKKSL